MPVPYPEDVLAHGEGSQRAQAVGAQDEECLGRGGQLDEGAAQQVCRNARDLLTILCLHLDGLGLPAERGSVERVNIAEDFWKTES